MDFELIHKKKMVIDAKYNNMKEFIEFHKDKMSKIKIERLSVNDNHRCSNKNCPKKASYKFNYNYYCWFHRIDLNIKNNLSL